MKPDQDAYVLLVSEAKQIKKTINDLDKWCHKRRNTDPQNPKFGLLVYAEGLRDGMARVLQKMGIRCNDHE